MFKCLEQRWVEGLAGLGPIFLSWLPRSSGQKQALGNDCQSFACDQNAVEDWREDGLLTGADNKLTLLITVFKVQSHWKK